MQKTGLSTKQTSPFESFWYGKRSSQRIDYIKLESDFKLLAWIWASLGFRHYAVTTIVLWKSTKIGPHQITSTSRQSPGIPHPHSPHITGRTHLGLAWVCLRSLENTKVHHKRPKITVAIGILFQKIDRKAKPSLSLRSFQRVVAFTKSPPHWKTLNFFLSTQPRHLSPEDFWCHVVNCTNLQPAAKAPSGFRVFSFWISVVCIALLIFCTFSPFICLWIYQVLGFYLFRHEFGTASTSVRARILYFLNVPVRFAIEAKPVIPPNLANNFHVLRCFSHIFPSTWTLSLL